MRAIGSIISHEGHFFLSRRTFLSLTKDISFSHEGHFFLSRRTFLSLTKNISFSHEEHFFLSQNSQIEQNLLRTGSTPKDSGPSPNPSPAGRGVVCEVTPTGLLAYFVEVFSLTELTDLTEPFWHTFRAHKIVAPPPNPSPAGRGVVCEVTHTGLLAYFVEFFSLTELTDLTEIFNQRFDPTEGLRHTEITERFN